jgi:mannose-6-phosphate isomerase class I
MCGFRPLLQLHHFLCASSPAHVPELREVIGESLCDKFLNMFNGGGDAYVPGHEEGSHEHDGVSQYPSLPRFTFDTSRNDPEDALRALYSALMSANHAVVEANVRALAQRLRSSVGGEAWNSLILDLHSQYGSDIGIFSIYFFNVLSLQRGEAIFLAPCLPHAYIRGELVELMACSDNVVRAGLTPKHKHVEELLSMLVYSSKPPLTHHMRPVILFESAQASLKLFAPPSEFSEFCLLYATAQAASSIDIPLPSASPHILLCLQVLLPPNPNVSYLPCCIGSSWLLSSLTLMQGKATVSTIPSTSSASSITGTSSVTALHCLLIAATSPCILRVHAEEDTTMY